MEQRDPTSLYVRINRAASLVWEGKAQSISSTNATGPFDILPMHASFLTYVQNTTIRVKPMSGDELVLECKEGIVHVESNVAQIYVDI